MIRQGFGGAHHFARRLQPTPSPALSDSSPSVGPDPDDEDDDEDDPEHGGGGNPVLDSGDDDDHLTESEATADDDVDDDAVDDTPVVDTSPPLNEDVPVVDDDTVDDTPVVDTDVPDGHQADDTDITDPSPALESDTDEDEASLPDVIPLPDPSPPLVSDPDDEEDDDNDSTHNDLAPGPPVLDEGDDDDHLTESEADPGDVQDEETDDDASTGLTAPRSTVIPTFATPSGTVYTFDGSQTTHGPDVHDGEWNSSETTVNGMLLYQYPTLGTDWTFMFDLKPGAPKVTDEYYLSMCTPEFGEGLYFHSLSISIGYAHAIRSKNVSTSFGLNEVPEWTTFQTVRIENSSTGTRVFRDDVVVATFGVADVNFEKTHIYLGSMVLAQDGSDYAGKRSVGNQMRNIKLFNFLISDDQRV